MNNDENFFVLCEKCNCVPDVRIIEDVDTEINVKCACAFEEKIRIKEFFNKMKNNVNISDVNSKKDFSDYYYNGDMFSEEKISKIYKKLTIAKKEIITNANKIKSSSIESLTRTRQKIEIAYQNYIIKTNDIFKLISILIHNYISLPNNVTALRNVLIHSTFLVKKCTSVENPKNVIDFFSCSKIIETSRNELILFPKKNNCLNSIEEKDISKFLITDKQIFLLLSDNTLKIYNIDTFHCELSINANFKGKVIDFLSNGNLVTYTSNKLFIYEINQQKELKEKVTLNIKDEAYKATLISKDIVAICTYGDHLKFFDVSTAKEIHTENNVKEIIALICENELLIYATIESKIVFYDITTHTEIKTLNKVICCKSESLFYKNAQLVVGGANAITLIDNNVKKIENSKFNAVTSISYQNGKLLLGCMLGNLILFDVNREAIEKEFEKAHEGEIRTIKPINNTILTIGADNIIKYWQF